MAARPAIRRLESPPKERYRELARDYDLLTAAGRTCRERAVEVLAAAAGDVVLDVGCGTGLNFAALENEIGPGGRLIGIDVSPDMLAQARARVEQHGWRNVRLIEAAAEDVALTEMADAALLSAVHDILRSARALTNLVRYMRPGGRVAAAGPKWVPWWRPDGYVVNACTWLVNRQYVTTFEGFDAPWSGLALLLDDLAVEEMFLGAAFVAVGCVRPGAAGPAHPDPRPGVIL